MENGRSGKQLRRGASLLPGSYLLKLARSSMAANNAIEALEYASQAVIFFQKRQGWLELVMSLHLLAEAHSRLGDYDAAVSTLQRSVEIEGAREADGEALLAAAYGYMQLGGTLAAMGSHEESLEAYKSAFQAQRRALGDMDLRVAETCRFLAEASLQAMHLDEAEDLSAHLLRMHEAGCGGAAADEASDRRLMALVRSSRGDHEGALQHLIAASTLSSRETLDAASTQACIGDTLAALGREAEARAAYESAIHAFELNGENAALASVYVSLSELYARAGESGNAVAFCEAASTIYEKQIPQIQDEELANGLVEIAAVYKTLGDGERASALLEKAIDILGASPKSLLGLGVLDEAKRHLS